MNSDADHAFALLVFDRLRHRLALRLVALHDAAQDPYDRDRWQERVIELRNRVRAVDTADAEQVLVCVEEWSQTLDDLEVFGPT